MEPKSAQATATGPVDYSAVAFEDLPPEEVNRRMRLVRGRRAQRRSKEFVRPVGQAEYELNPECLLDPAERVSLQLARIAALLTAILEHTRPFPISGAQSPSPQYVSLNQAAAWVSKDKKTVQRALNADPNAPTPDVEGGGGKGSYWRWDRIRPWLEQQYKRILPPLLPTDPLS